MKRFPSIDEIESIMKKLESGFDLEDWEIWVRASILAINLKAAANKA